MHDSSEDVKYFIIFIIFGILAVLITVMILPPSRIPVTYCPIDIQVGDVVTYVTGMRGEVITCFPSDNNLKIFTGEEYRTWNTDSITDPADIMWPPLEDQ